MKFKQWLNQTKSVLNHETLVVVYCNRCTDDRALFQFRLNGNNGPNTTALIDALAEKHVDDNMPRISNGQIEVVLNGFTARMNELFKGIRACEKRIAAKEAGGFDSLSVDQLLESIYIDKLFIARNC